MQLLHLVGLISLLYGTVDIRYEALRIRILGELISFITMKVTAVNLQTR